MPLTRIDHIGHDASLGLWHMTEDVADYERPRNADLSSFHTAFRLKEELMEYSLLHALTGHDNLVIRHAPSGKPLIDGWNISISHTRGWGAMILSETHAVAVDIEYYSDRVRKVVPRFIRPDEMTDELSAQLINWSAKETVYKLFSEEDLQYFEMRLQPFASLAKGTVMVDDLKVSKTQVVDYEINSDYVMTWAIQN